MRRKTKFLVLHFFDLALCPIFLLMAISAKSWIALVITPFMFLEIYVRIGLALENLYN
jgi:hypothetical protein